MTYRKRNNRVPASPLNLPGTSANRRPPPNPRAGWCSRAASARFRPSIHAFPPRPAWLKHGQVRRAPNRIGNRSSLLTGFCRDTAGHIAALWCTSKAKSWARRIPHRDQPHPTGNQMEEESKMDSSRIPRVTRRRFLKETGLTLAAAGCGPVISAPFVSPALGRHQDAVDRAMEPFRSGVRQMVRQFRQGLGSEEQDRGHRRPHPGRQRRRARGRRSLGRIGSRPVRLERRRRRAPLPQIPRRRDEPGRVDREEIRQGQHDRPADRLQSGRQDLVGIPRFLHQLPLHVSQEHVGRDRDEAGHLGQCAHRRRQAESQGPSGRHFARAQQRPEHDVARPAVELRRRSSGRRRQESRAQQQGDGRSRQVRRRALQGSDDVGSAVVGRLRATTAIWFRASAR